MDHQVFDCVALTVTDIVRLAVASDVASPLLHYLRLLLCKRDGMKMM